MKKFNKIFIPQADNSLDGNIRALYPIDDAAWIWHPELERTSPAFLCFSKSLKCDNTTLRCHLSADQRFEFYVDDQLVSKGPERGDVNHWSFNSYKIELEAGHHEIKVNVWNLQDLAPQFMMTYQPGFVFKAEGEFDNLLTTGNTTWKVHELKGWSETEIKLGKEYHVVGKSIEFDGREWFAAEKNVDAVIVREKMWSNDLGGGHHGWKMTPATLPDMDNEYISPGRIKAVIENKWQPEHLFSDDEVQKAKADLEAISIPPNSNMVFLWDFEDYYCGYSVVEVNGGRDSIIEWLWAESLFCKDLKSKENRNDIIGKRFYGFGDRFVCDGENRKFESHRYLSGRYALITVKTGNKALEIKKLQIAKNNYPLKKEYAFDSSDSSLAPAADICGRVLQMCAHDSYMDCPYYEQLMYGGDTRIEALVSFVMNNDSRLQQRAIALFDYSRINYGLTSSRYPSRSKQLIPTFSMIYIWQLEDFLYWRGNKKWLKNHINSARAVTDILQQYINSDGILGILPGWSFVDWVPEWENGWPPGAKEGKSSIVNLIYYWTLKKAANLEEILGEDLLAEHLRRQSDALANNIKRLFFQNDTGLFSDDINAESFSEHAQCLAILSGLCEAKEAEKLFENMLKDNTLAETTVYFKHYLFETMKFMDRGDLILEKFDFWRELPEKGFKTVPEKPEPSRSDCHAWGAHPLFHMHASLLGLRPTSPGFKTLEIKPSPGDLKNINSVTPHPQGLIECNLIFNDNCVCGNITLPAEISGVFYWRGKSINISKHTKVSL